MAPELILPVWLGGWAFLAVCLCVLHGALGVDSTQTIFFVVYGFLWPIMAVALVGIAMFGGLYCLGKMIARRPNANTSDGKGA